MKRKILIPDETAVVAFDETEAYELFSQSVSYVKQPLAQIGERALKELHLKIEDPLHALTNFMLEAELVIGQTSHALKTI